MKAANHHRAHPPQAAAKAPWHERERSTNQRDARAPRDSVVAAPRVEAAASAEQQAQIAASPFSALGLSAALVRALLREGYAEPTPIQTQAIPHLLAQRDVLGCAQTGTGKTAAFVLPLLQYLEQHPHLAEITALVLTPTRELAAQISERIAAYGKFMGVRHTVIYGGVGQGGQERELKKRPNVVVATPGRLLDLMQQGLVKLGSVEFLVLDEADTMLDMGFINDVRRIIAAMPAKRQTLLFSATMPPAIENLASKLLTNPARVAVAKVAAAADTVAQSVYFVSKTDKRALLERILKDPAMDRVLVFTRTKHGANRVSEQLTRAGVQAAAIHGNKSQRARENALEQFRRGSTRVLVATDIAARGIDVQSVSHVVNFDLPNVAETYVHRIGRTGRAGASGRAISFCDRDEKSFLIDIERLIRQRIPVAEGATPAAPAVHTMQAAPTRPQRVVAPVRHDRREPRAPHG